MGADLATADTAARIAAGSPALDPARWAADCCIAALASVGSAGLAIAAENFAAAGRQAEPVVVLAAGAAAELVLELAAAAPAVVAEPAPAR